MTPREALAERLLTPGDPGFDEARHVWNGRFAARPHTVVRCASSDDVVQALALAGTRGWRVSVRGGGHSYSGKTVAPDTLLLDLSPMSFLHVDREARTAEVGPGVTCGALDAATQAHGLAAPLPTVSTVGVVGAAIGGGSGYMGRACGLTIDNVLGMEVVTADGRVLRSSLDAEPDLFWALRGAGANFGIVTSVTLRLHEVGPHVLAGQIIYPFDEAERLLRGFRDVMRQAPDALQCYPFMFRIPPLEAFPAAYHGQPALDFVLCHLDPSATDAVAPLRTLGTPILDAVGPAPYTTVQQSFDANLPGGQRYFSRALDLTDMTDAAIDTAAAHVRRMRGPLSSAYFDPAGGAIGRVEPDATAYAGRRTRFGFHVLAGWLDAEDDADVMGWATEFHGAMAPHVSGTVYVNLLGDGEDQRVTEAYGDNLPRLAALKRTWDPDNVFRSNINIAPAAVRHAGH